ncbi:Polyprotein [Arachis hypogaea]|nr:Polyprotein [Arachis hypogaea]
MISPVRVQTTHDQDDPPVHFYENGRHIYVSHINGHFIWDVDPSTCDSDCDYTDQWNIAPKFRRKKLSQKGLIDYSYQTIETIPCIVTLRPYEEELPPLVTQTNEKKITRRPYVVPQEITPHGHQATTPQEEVLNWHTDIVVSQNKNKLLNSETSFPDKLFSLIKNSAYIENRYFGPEFHKKDRELAHVKAQLCQIEMDRDRMVVPQALAIDSLSMYPNPYPLYSHVLFPSIYSLPETPNYESIFKFTYHLARQANTEKCVSLQGQHYSSQTQPQPPLQPRIHPPWRLENFFRESTSTDLPLKDKSIKEGSPIPGRTINALTLNDQSDVGEITNESTEETTKDSAESTEWSKEDYVADLSAIAMVNLVEEEEEEIFSEKDELTTSVNPPQIGSSEAKIYNKWFTFDDIPPSRYGERLNEFGAWIEINMVNPNLSSRQVLADFINRMTGNLREWINNLSEKDLEKHYKRMAAKYYPLGENSNPPLKQVFMASLPDELQPKLQRMMMTLCKEVATTTIGEIHQLALAVLDKLC